MFFTKMHLVQLSFAIFCIGYANYSFACDNEDIESVCDSRLIPNAPFTKKVEIEGYCLRNGICEGFFNLPTKSKPISIQSIAFSEQSRDSSFLAVENPVQGSDFRLRARVSAPHRYGLDTVITDTAMLPVELSGLSKSNVSWKRNRMKILAFKETGCEMGNDSRVYFPACLVDKKTGTECQENQKDKLRIEFDPSIAPSSVTVKVFDKNRLESFKDQNLNRPFYSEKSVVFYLEQEILKMSEVVLVEVDAVRRDSTQTLAFCIQG